MRNKVVVFPKPREEVTRGGVHIPKDAQRPQIIGMILAVGPDVNSLGENGLREGDIVIFPQYAGTEVVLEDENGEERTVLILDDVNVIAKVSIAEALTKTSEP